MNLSDAVRAHMERTGKTPHDAFTFADYIACEEAQAAAASAAVATSDAPVA